MAQPSDILCANLRALSRRDPALAQRLERSEAASLLWAQAKSGTLTASFTREGSTPVQLASRFDPLAEARQLVAQVDHGKHGGIVVLGLGLGYHVRQLASELSDWALLVIFEPDLTLLRAVLERVDLSTELSKSNVVLFDASVDRGQLIQAVERFAGAMTQGTALVTHPPTRLLHPKPVREFAQLLADALAYLRTNIATTLVNSARTVRNLMLNLPHYAAGAWVDELFESCKGLPAVCVGAGPSLARNAHLLADPQLRRNLVVICAQTTLRPLLERGVEPDFVTALDFHEISRRFFEDLPPLPGVTLVAEPLANSAILDHFPGPIRLTDHHFLDRFLGAHARARKPIKHGATVAHLSFYLAQFLGCDPILLVGQDLGFSDGLYYCPGTAIHHVWAPELGAFNTLEMMEWQRVVRHRGNLQKRDDIHGRPIYTDEQMLTYLRQFERDFRGAPQTLIDATEGGLPKEHTQRMPLEQALRRFATRPVAAPPRPAANLDPDRLHQALRVLEERTAQFRELRQLQTRGLNLLRQMLEHQRDLPRMEKLFAEMDRTQDRVTQLQDAFELINQINSIGAFKRDRADRAINAAGDLSELERQRRRIERDIENLDWMNQAADELLEICHAARQRMTAAIRREQVRSVPPASPEMSDTLR